MICSWNSRRLLRAAPTLLNLRSGKNHLGKNFTCPLHYLHKSKYFLELLFSNCCMKTQTPHHVLWSSVFCSLVRWPKNSLFILVKLKRCRLTLKSRGDNSPLLIHDEKIMQVCSNRYLGVHSDDLFRCEIYVHMLCSHLQHKLYF